MSRMSPSLAATSSSVSTPKRQAHAPLGAELVDEKRVLRALRVLEEERRPARLDDAIRDLGDLEVGVDLGRDAPQLALALEERDPLAEVSRRCHGAVSLWSEGLHNRVSEQVNDRGTRHIEPHAARITRQRGAPPV